MPAGSQSANRMRRGSAKISGRASSSGYAGWSRAMIFERRRSTSRSSTPGFCTISARKKDGHSTAACATSPHSPQPTQPLLTCATGSTLSGSLEARTVSEGQPDRRMQEWSPVHTSSSTPKRVRTTRLPALSLAATWGRSRRWRSSWHSPSATITLSPGSGVVYAETAQRVLDSPVRVGGALPGGRRASLLRRRGQQLLCPGRRGVAVLHDHQHRVAVVQEVGGDARQEAVVPEAAVAHDGDRPLRRQRTHAGAARETHSVAEQGVALRERLEGCESVAADVDRDVRAPDVLRDQLHRREHGTLGAADAERRRSRG